jgi:8-oxo-dGTP pyrophosphatase MutT (NUDIX family)
MRNHLTASRIQGAMAESAGTQRRLAAVVLPIFANPPYEVVFIERAQHLRRHAGQIAFPGGALDDEDGGDLTRAGLRELHEEIGIPPEAVTIVGRLGLIRQTNNVFNVTPFVGVVAPGTTLVVDLNEASAAHRVPLAAIVEPGAVHPGVEIIGNYRRETHIFDYGSLHVWGLTGTMLDMFVRRFNRAGSALRAALDERLLR